MIDQYSLSLSLCVCVWCGVRAYCLMVSGTNYLFHGRDINACGDDP
jgi:hypothetical protein